MREAAIILHIHTNTVLELAGSGRLRGAKMGKKWVFSEADVYAYRDAEIARQTKARRAGEIVGLTWDRVNVEGCCCRLPLTKNGTAREVALSAEALRILRQLPRGEGKVFGLSGDMLDALFRKAKARAMIEDLHFHDARHEAITRLSKKLDVLDLARMVGIRDMRILMVYYNATATEIAGRLG